VPERDAQADGTRGNAGAAAAEELRGRRFLALGFVVVSALFSGVVLGVLLGTYFSETETPTVSPTMEALQAKLAQDPMNEQLQQAVRDLDVKLRRTYFSNRKRVAVGAVLLCGGLVALLISARWYASLDPGRPLPTPLADRTDEERWLSRRRRSLLAVAGVAGACVVFLLVVTLVGGASYPRAAPGETRPGTVTQAPQEPAEPAVVATLPDGGFTENWPRFRGPTGMGLAPAGDWPRSWDGNSGENILWKVPVPRSGKSSPVIWGNRIFLTGADEQKQEVFCFRRDTGELLWRADITVRERNTEGEPEELEVFEDTGYAASTPATDGERVYAIFATADVAAVDFTGNVVWSRNLGDPENFYGLAGSLLYYQGLLLFQFDRGGDPDEGLSALVAMNPETGQTVWSTPRPVDNSWSTPIVVETEAGPELIASADPWVIGYDPELGTELWRAEGLSGDVAPSPVYADGLVYVTNEYAKVMAIRAGGLGDVTQTHVAWTSQEGMLSNAPSPVCDGTYLLDVHSSGNLSCYNAKTGELVWEDRVDSSVWASPLLVGETVYLFGEDGKTYFLALGEEYKLLGGADVGEEVSATPAFADSRIYVRGKDHLFCIAREDGKE